MRNNKHNEEQPLLDAKDNETTPNAKPSSYKSITTSLSSENNQVGKDARKEHQNIDIGSVNVTILTMW